MTLRSIFAVAVLALAVPVTVACGDDAESPQTSAQATDPVNGKTISELALTGDDRTTLGEGETTQLAATVRYADGTSRDVTREAQWNTSNAGRAIVSTTGLVTAIDEGPVEISVSYNGITQSDSILITN